MHLLNLYEDKARAGDGVFAVAHALLSIAQEQKRLADKVGALGFDGFGQAPGVGEAIVIALRDLNDRVTEMGRDNA